MQAFALSENLKKKKANIKSEKGNIFTIQLLLYSIVCSVSNVTIEQSDELELMEDKHSERDRIRACVAVSRSVITNF